jgi:hypothetical protein
MFYELKKDRTFLSYSTLKIQIKLPAVPSRVESAGKDGFPPGND